MLLIASWYDGATMNEKITKKVGEACAFAAVLETTFTNNESVMRELLTEAADTLAATAISQQTALKTICETAGTTDTLMPKVAKTSEKITRMGEMYVGDDWDDAAEVLEWMSFFVGGAIVHWQLIAGAGEAMAHAELQATASDGVAYYENLMQQLKTAATTIGTARAQ